LATWPGWKKLDDARGGAEAITFDAFLNLQKATLDHKGAPKIGTVRASLVRVGAAIDALRSALDEMDPRSAELLTHRAGGSLNVLVTPPEVNLSDGRDKLQRLDSSLSEARSWARKTIEDLPPQDLAGARIPGLDAFARSMAHVWETYAPGKMVTASRNNKTWPYFMHKLLAAGGYRCSRVMVEGVAREVVAQLNKDRPDRIVVAVEDRHLSFGELYARHVRYVRRKSVRKKRQRFATR
jgi:hypothetical protein